MANLSITTVCNKKCVYCFAYDATDDRGKSHMSITTYSKALEYLERSGINQVRLMGGEPTLHPQFISFLKMALDRNFDLMVFTNGLMPIKVLDFLESINHGRISILLNMIHPDEGNPNGVLKQKDVISRLGHLVVPGINIYSKQFDLDYIVDYFHEFELQKEIRLGIAHPMLSRNNVFLHPKDYSYIGEKIIELKKKMVAIGVNIGFDCGFVPCMFPIESFELLKEELKKTGNCCLPLIDFLSDGTIISCYPLNNLLKIEMDDQMSSTELVKRFEIELELFKDVGIYPHCSTCPLFKTRCNGGCMAFRIQRFMH